MNDSENTKKKKKTLNKQEFRDLKDTINKRSYYVMNMRDYVPNIVNNYHKKITISHNYK